MVLSSRSLQITNSSDSPPSKVQFSISLNRGVAPLFAAVPVHVDPHLGKRQCSRCSQPFPCWLYPRWRHERNGRFCIQCCKRSCASCISTKASGDCLSKWPNLTASVPGHYHQWLELIVRNYLQSSKRWAVADRTNRDEEKSYCDAWEPLEANHCAGSWRSPGDGQNQGQIARESVVASNG